MQADGAGGMQQPGGPHPTRTCTCSTASATSGSSAATWARQRVSSAVPAPSPRYGASTPSVRMYSLGPCKGRGIGLVREDVGVGWGWRKQGGDQEGAKQIATISSARQHPPAACAPGGRRWRPPARRCGRPAVEGWSRCRVSGRKGAHIHSPSCPAAARGTPARRRRRRSPAPTCVTSGTASTSLYMRSG